MAGPQFNLSLGQWGQLFANGSSGPPNLAPPPNQANPTNNPHGFGQPPTNPFQLTLIHNANSMPNMPPPPAKPDRKFLRTLFAVISSRNPNMPLLPIEIQDDIIDMVLGTRPRLSLASRPSPPSQAPARNPALTPPSSGRSPLMELPVELRREIFAGSLSDRLVAIQPTCDDRPDAARPKRKGKDRKFDKSAHNIPNLMTICKHVCGEIGEVMYEERTFVIHVHEGLKTGGVEILNAGRQPLQYQDSCEDKRFEKFGHGEAFGFRRMKKIVIQIHPTTEDHDKHLALNTHFMNLALCRLLERPNNDKERITSIKIEFAARATPAPDLSTRAAIMRHEKPWLDVNGPRQSSIHNVSDIELLLRPFAMLTRCHSASIELPAYLASDPQLSAFVTDLEHSMMSKAGTLMPNDTLEHKVEQLREEMEAHVVSLLYGNGNNIDVAKLTDEEVFQPAPDTDDDDEGDSGDSDPDEGFQLLISKNSRGNKHPRSASDAANAALISKRTKKEQEKDEKARRKQLMDMVKESLSVSGYKRTAKQVRQLVDGMVARSGVPIIRDDAGDEVGEESKTKGRILPKSSLFGDLEFANFDEDLQEDLAIQLSMGKSREELGLEEVPMDVESEGGSVRDDSNVDDWKAELREKWSRGEITAQELEAEEAARLSTTAQQTRSLPKAYIARPSSEVWQTIPTTKKYYHSSTRGKPAMGLKYSSAYHPMDTTTTQHSKDTAATQHDEIIDYDSDMADAGSVSSDFTADGGAESSSPVRHPGLLSKVPFQFGNIYGANLAHSYAGATPGYFNAPSAPLMSMSGNSYLPTTTGAQEGSATSYLSGQPTPTASTNTYNPNPTAVTTHDGFTPPYQGTTVSEIDQFYIKHMKRKPAMPSTQTQPATQVDTGPVHVVNPIASQPSIFGNGNSQLSVLSTSNPLNTQRQATPRNLLQAEAGGIGMLSSDGNAAKGTQDVEAANSQDEDSEMMDAYVNFEGDEV